MGLVYSKIPIRGTDVSSFQGLINWDLMAAQFSGIRVGYGRTIDFQFVSNWKSAKRKKINRMPYWYMDYYSNWCNTKSAVFGMEDAAWGREQAETCWKQLKDDPQCIIWLDVENGGPEYSTPLTDPETQEHAETIARAFLERIDELNGKFNGIYTSVGWLPWFWKWFRNRPLWVAWYNDTKTPEQVLAAVKSNGWTGTCYIWKYSSDGDLDDNGTSDGRNMGVATKTLDLNYFLQPVSIYNQLFNSDVIIVDPPIPDPVEENFVTLPIMKVLVDGLRVRDKPSTVIGKVYNNISSKVGDDRIILEKVIIGNEVWGKIGVDQYSAIKIGDKEYMR